VIDDNVFEKYITAVYWAIVTCATVGYGDIVPQNMFEKMMCICTLIFGVAFFSYLLSALANIFATLRQTNADLEAKVSEIKDLSLKYNFGPILEEKILHYFRKTDHPIEISHDYAVDDLVENYLPTNLKQELVLHIYSSPINIIPFF